MLHAISYITSRFLVLVILVHFTLGTITECDNTNKKFEELSVPDCNCRIGSVDYAVNEFISPILSNLTTQAFFRYFKVELDKPCPYWKEDGQCMMEGCSVCTCDDDEIPKPWISTSNNYSNKKSNDFGWITSSTSSYGYDGKGHDDSLGRIVVATEKSNEAEIVIKEQERMQYETFKHEDTEINERYGYNEILNDQSKDYDDHDDWTILDDFSDRMMGTHSNEMFQYSQFSSMHDTVPATMTIDSSSSSSVSASYSAASYVNLLNNPESFTGYSGPSARKVWKSIQEENCFGEINDKCLEKRIFHRLMSGLQSSISTHIARKYLHSDNHWGPNYPLYWSAVGNHADRLDNMYFAFLFLLRAVVRASDVLLSFPYITGNDEEDQRVYELLNQLLLAHSNSHKQNKNTSSSSSSKSRDDILTNHTIIQECQRGFDESELFQVSDLLKGPQYWNSLEEKQSLKEEFMLKFRNISSIMNCVTCEKCQLWGKLQILGFGTAIKILLTPQQELQTFSEHLQYLVSDHRRYNNSTCHYNLDSKTWKKLLNRQEIIALINTLNQLSTSLVFASEAASHMKQSGAAIDHNSETTYKIVTEENMKNELLDNIDHIGKYKTNNLYTRTDRNKDSNENQFKHIDIDIHVYKSDNLNSKSSSSSFSSDLHYKMFLLIIWSALMGLIIIYLN